MSLAGQLRRPVIETMATLATAIDAPAEKPHQAVNDPVRVHAFDHIGEAPRAQVHTANAYAALRDAGSSRN
jgi:hypothetical protein